MKSLCQSAFLDAVNDAAEVQRKRAEAVAKVHEAFNRRAEQHDINIRNIQLEMNIVGHPKLPKLYEIAYDHGHSAGFDEVEAYYRKFGQLLQD